MLSKAHLGGYGVPAIVCAVGPCILVIDDLFSRFASLIFDTSIEFRYTCVVFMELCPMPSLIIGMGMSMSLAMLAHVCRAVYVVSGIFNPVISPIFFKL